MTSPKIIIPTIIEKTCPTCNYIFSIKYKLRNRKTYCSKRCANRNKNVISKMLKSQAKTFQEKYGMHPMRSESTKENLKKSIQKKYGVDWFSSTEDWNRKVKETNLIKYGTEWFTNHNQYKKTCLQRYGVENFRQTKEYSDKYKKTCLQRYGVPHASTPRKIKIKQFSSIFEKFMQHPFFCNFKPLFTLDEYNGVFFKNYKFECKRCGSQQEYSLDDGKFPICINCDNSNLLYFQKEIYEFIKELLNDENQIIINDRSILYPKELDIVIPSHNLAIECDGLIWHSETIGKKNKLYHLYKTQKAACKGYQLLHIFDSEWETKKELIQSILTTSLKKSSFIYNGRDCEIHKIDNNTCNAFLERNHLQGKDHSSLKYGLFHNNELVSVMTFVRPRYDTNIEWEMSRFCNKLFTIINGGASKLFSAFIKEINPKNIVSYSDRRYFNGLLYQKLGFQFVYNSPPSYWYIINNYTSIQNRMNWQKHKLVSKLSVFDLNLSEWENMKANGFDRIWDCGHGKWVWTRI